MTVEEKAALALKIKETLTLAELRHPGSLIVKILHGQALTVANLLEDQDGVARGTYQGAAGVYHPDSGGTDGKNP